MPGCPPEAEEENPVKPLLLPRATRKNTPLVLNAVTTLPIRKLPLPSATTSASLTSWLKGTSAAWAL